MYVTPEGCPRCRFSWVEEDCVEQVLCVPGPVLLLRYSRDAPEETACQVCARLTLSRLPAERAASRLRCRRRAETVCPTMP